jgi:hypothetical protein
MRMRKDAHTLGGGPLDLQEALGHGCFCGYPTRPKASANRTRSYRWSAGTRRTKRLAKVYGR